MSKEEHIAYIATELFGSWYLRAKAVPFPIIAPAATQIACTEDQGVCSGGPVGDGSGPTLMKTSFPPQGAPSQSFVS
jgi:hypothetical protein